MTFKANKPSNMPSRSLNSSVMRWPDAAAVSDALASWAARARREHPELIRVGYVGSYARGDWGVGSDLDVVLVVSRSGVPFAERAAEWDLTSLPVPTDVFVYTADELESLVSSRFRQILEHEAAWLTPRE